MLFYRRFNLIKCEFAADQLSKDPALTAFLFSKSSKNKSMGQTH